MQNPAARFLLLLALPALSIAIAGCSVSNLGLTDAAGESPPDSLPDGKPDPGLDTPSSAEAAVEAGAEPNNAATGSDAAGSTTRAEQPSPDAAANQEPVPVRLSTDPTAIYRPGTCYAEAVPGSDPLEVRCDEPHRIEIYAVGRLAGEDGAPFQGLDAARELCDVDFRAITGLGIGLATVLDRSVLRPSEETWQTGERDVICYVVYPDPTDQSLAAIDPVRGFDTVSIYGLHPGDCLLDFGRSKTSFGLVDCAAPHDAEVFAGVPVEGDEFPGGTEIDRIADELCFGQNFQDFVGAAYELSSVESLGSRPTAQTWAMGHRTITCILTDELVRTGSFAGTAL